MVPSQKLGAETVACFKMFQKLDNEWYRVALNMHKYRWLFIRWVFFRDHIAHLSFFNEKLSNWHIQLICQETAGNHLILINNWKIERAREVDMYINMNRCTFALPMTTSEPQLHKVDTMPADYEMRSSQISPSVSPSETISNCVILKDFQITKYL